jgi:hypothetical protein
MSNRYHKAIIGAVIMVRAGKGKAQSVEFQLQQIKMVEAQKGVLRDYEGRLWPLCHPEKEDNTPNRTTIGMTFWDDEHWTRTLPILFIATRYSNKKKDSVIEVKTFHYSMYFENA